MSECLKRKPKSCYGMCSRNECRTGGAHCSSRGLATSPKRRRGKAFGGNLSIPFGRSVDSASGVDTRETHGGSLFCSCEMVAGSASTADLAAKRVNEGVRYSIGLKCGSVDPAFSLAIRIGVFLTPML